MSSISGLLKPCYVYAPSTLLRRIGLALWRKRKPYRRVVLPWGATLEVNIEETIGGEVFRQNVFDISVSEVAWRLLQPGDHAVDVGANIGYMSSLFAARVGGTGTVDSFEPHPLIFPKLAANAALTRQVSTATVNLHNVALGDRTGIARLVEPDAFPMNEGMATLVSDRQDVTGDYRGYDVPIATLDALLDFGPVALMKIDVEGFEPQVLAGSRRLLGERCIQNIIYEAHDCERSMLHELLQGYGYSIFGIGYTLGGLKISTGTGAPAIARAHESPSYLATLNPAGVLPKLSGRGWAVLSNRR